MFQTLKNNIESSEYLNSDVSEETGLLVYRTDNFETNHKLVFWNSTKFFINEGILNYPDSNYFVRDINGDFEVIKRDLKIGDKNCICVGIIPIRWHYFIENTYLKSHFNKNIIPENLIVIKDDHTSTDIKSSFGTHLFYIDYISDISGKTMDTLTEVTRFICLILILIALYLFAAETFVKKGFAKALIFFTTGIVLLRVIIYLFPSYFYYKDLSLFDNCLSMLFCYHRCCSSLIIMAIGLFCRSIK